MTPPPVPAFILRMTEPIRLKQKSGLGLDRELYARAQGFTCIAGLDEVGRGPLAGPVVSAAVVLDLDKAPQGLADSKALTAARREAERALDRVLALGLGIMLILIQPAVRPE